MYERVLGRFHSVRSGWRPLTWRAACPAHHDRKPSLSLWVSARGFLFVRCKAGCTLAEVLDAVGLSMRDLTPYAGQEDKGRWTRQPKEVDWFDYRDEAGQVLYQVIRYEPKDFRQRRPNPCLPGNWLWGLGKDESRVRLVPYQLPELLASYSKRAVFVVEGERKVHALEEWDFVATCGVGGAGMGWQEEYSPYFRGRQVVILPDNDRAGRKHAALVAGSLLLAGVSSIRVVSLPGLPKGGDILDFKARGGTQGELIKLVMAAPCWAPKGGKP